MRCGGKIRRLSTAAAAEQPDYQPLVAQALKYAVQGITSLREAMALSGQEEELWEAEEPASLEETLSAAHLHVTDHDDSGRGELPRH